jgi:hypothetical protein
MPLTHAQQLAADDRDRRRRMHDFLQQDRTRQQDARDRLYGRLAAHYPDQYRRVEPDLEPRRCHKCPNVRPANELHDGLCECCGEPEQ